MCSLVVIRPFLYFSHRSQSSDSFCCSCVCARSARSASERPMPVNMAMDLRQLSNADPGADVEAEASDADGAEELPAADGADMVAD